MKRIFLLSSILLLSTCWAVAQSNQSASDQGSMMSSEKTTVQGCLSGSDGSYTLTDKTGTAYKLSGDTAQLQAHVGHTVQVTGTTSPGMNTSHMGNQSGSMSEAAESQPTLNVTSFKHMMANCNGM